MPNIRRAAGALWDKSDQAVKKMRDKLDLLDEAKLAEQYPDIGMPEWRYDKKKVDAKKGPWYWGKGNSPEEEQLEKLRNSINKHIIKPGNYEPMFDESSRYFADPSYYGNPERTLDVAWAKTPKTQAEHRALYNTPQARKSLLTAYDKGLSDDSVDWYAMGQLQDAYIKELGPELGPMRYKEDFADAMAATTGGSAPTPNLLMSAYGNFQRAGGHEMPRSSMVMPHPIGGRYATGNMKMYDDVMNQGRLMTASDQPKRNNFSGNFQGFRDMATIDEQMTGGMTEHLPKKLTAPPGESYGAFEEAVRDVADKRGATMDNMQGVAWAGYKGTEGYPMIRHVNEMIERTSRVTGRDPQDVLKGYIHRNMPMYGVGGTAVGAGYLMDPEEEEDPLMLRGRGYM